MAGSVLMAGAALAAAMLTGGVVVLGGAVVAAQRANAAADAAALGAADVFSGALAHDADPCSVAGQIAQAHAVVLDSCLIEVDSVIVQVWTAYAGWTAAARARAGPPDRLPWRISDSPPL